MKQIACSECRQTSPMNEVFDVLGRRLCRPCAETALSKLGDKEITEDSVSRQVDPTVCAQCGADNGDNELPAVAGLPVCAPCEENFRNRPYPLWLRVSFAALIALAIFCFIWNWRFLAGYREIQEMHRAFRASDWERAASLGEAASRHVPEVPELAAIANFNRGVALLSNEQDAQAVEAFRKARMADANLGPVLDQMTLRAEAGMAFDAKDYDLFLTKTKALAAAVPGDKGAAAGVASAYACKYAVSGSEQDRAEALRHLDEAAKLAGPTDPEFQEYRERIEHRLETREIISRKEYQRRFPSGYRAGSKT